MFAVAEDGNAIVVEGGKPEYGELGEYVRCSFKKKNRLVLVLRTVTRMVVGKWKEKIRDGGVNG